MIIDGKAIADRFRREIADTVATQERRPVLAVVVVGDDPVMQRFVRIKKDFAAACDIHIEEHAFKGTIDTDTLLRKVEDLALDDSVHGILVQLPLPEHVDTETILGAIPVEKDVDVISPTSLTAFAAGTSTVLPPVIGALKEVLTEAGVQIEGKHVVVMGQGYLVGKPAATWLAVEGAHVTVLDEKDGDIIGQTGNADILVLGAGVPGLIQPDMIRDGVVLLDAGTSESAGKLRGDADPSCASKCSVFTPVPGGIGPLTVAILFKNLITLHE